MLAELGSAARLDHRMREHLEHSIIRIRQGEYRAIPNSGLFAHFNLAVAGHLVNEVYSLPRILTPGRDPDKPPILSFDDIWIGRCVEFIPRIHVTEVPPRLFDMSMSHMKNPKELEHVIWGRYSRSRPHLCRDTVREMGVSVTVLELFDRVSL